MRWRFLNKGLLHTNRFAHPERPGFRTLLFGRSGGGGCGARREEKGEAERGREGGGLTAFREGSWIGNKVAGTGEEGDGVKRGME